MGDEIETLVVGVRADVSGFARDVAAMREDLQGGLAGGADRAGQAIERGLLRAVRTGKFGFEDLKRTALSVMADIAASAVRGGLGAIGAGAGGGGGGVIGLATSLISSALGLPGRATGGPVSPGRAFVVGERGPELFVPTSSGIVHPAGAGGGLRDVRIAIQVNAPPGENSRLLARSARQVARAVRGALAD